MTKTAIDLAREESEQELTDMIENAIISIALCEAEDESSYTIMDAIATALGHKDLTTAYEIVGDHSNYLAMDILRAGYSKAPASSTDGRALLSVQERLDKACELLREAAEEIHDLRKYAGNNGAMISECRWLEGLAFLTEQSR